MSRLRMKARADVCLALGESIVLRALKEPLLLSYPSACAESEQWRPPALWPNGNCPPPRVGTVSAKEPPPLIVCFGISKRTRSRQAKNLLWVPHPCAFRKGGGFSSFSTILVLVESKSPPLQKAQGWGTRLESAWRNPSREWTPVDVRAILVQNEGLYSTQSYPVIESVGILLVQERIHHAATAAGSAAQIADPGREESRR